MERPTTNCLHKGMHNPGCWAKRSVRSHGIQAWCVGPRHRHRQTWETVVSEGNTWPDASFHDALDELPAEEVLPLSLPHLMQREGALGEAARTLVAQFGQGKPPMEQLMTIIDAGLGLWMAGEVTHPSVESWPAFKGRVTQTLAGVGDPCPSECSSVGGHIGGVYCHSTRTHPWAEPIGNPAEYPHHSQCVLHNPRDRDRCTRLAHGARTHRCLFRGVIAHTDLTRRYCALPVNGETSGREEP